MPSLSLSRYSVLCPLHGCSSSAPRQADPGPTSSRPHHSLPLGTPSASFTAGTGPGNRGAFRANLYILGSLRSS